MKHESKLYKMKVVFRKVFKRINLRLTLLIFILGPILGLLILTTSFAVQNLEKILERRLQEEVQLIARAIKKPVINALKKGELSKVQESIRSALEIQRVYTISVYDHKGQLIKTFGQGEQPEKKQDIQAIKKKENVGEYDRLESEKVYSFFIPLFKENKSTVGLLNITRKKSEINRDIYDFRRDALIAVCIVTLILIALILFTYQKFIEKPMNTLLNNMKRVESGQKDHRASIQGPKEISQLATTFNDTLNSLQSAQKEVTLRKKREEELENQLQHQEKLAVIGQLAAGVAHELGTPLATINGIAQKSLSTKNSNYESFQTILEESNRMSKIVRELLDFSRKEQKKPQICQVQKNIEDSLFSLYELVQDKNINIKKNIDDPETYIWSDPSDFKQVLINLINNSIDAIGENGYIQIYVKNDELKTSITIDDDGEGISDEIRSEVFNPFFTTKPVGVGTGLGLAVAYNLVRNAGGRITIHDSDVMSGAKVVMEYQKVNKDDIEGDQ